MELLQEVVQVSVIQQPITHQFHLGEDVNVPDAKEDVMQILQGYGKIYIHETQKMEQYLKVRGYLKYQVLYATEDIERRISCVEGSIPVEEMIYVEGGQEAEYYVRCNQVDFTVSRIHSRKLSLKSLVELEVRSMGIKEEVITVDVVRNKEEDGVEEGWDSCCKKYGTMPILELVMTKKDTLRVKEEIKLSGTKENIGGLLMNRMGNVKLDSRCGRDEISFHGELEVFSMYVSDEWKEDYVAQSVNFDGRMECQGLEEQMFHFMRYEVEDLSVDTQMDEDGEMRVLHIEATLKMEVNIYKEKEYEILEDMYLLKEKCELERRPIYLESLLLQNQSKCKVSEVLVLPELRDELLQVCTANGRVQVERMTMAEDRSGIEVEGILHIDVLYIKGDDRCPYGSWQGMVPFTHVIECKADGEMSYSVESHLEQIAIAMAGNGEVEVKAVVNFHSFIRNQQIMMGISKVEERAFAKEEMEKQPGIIGYIYKKEDNMWEIAKHFHTTIDGILTNNKIDEKDIKEGTKLLIFKENVSIL